MSNEFFLGRLPIQDLLRRRRHTEVESSTDPNYIKRELYRIAPKETLPRLKDAVIFAEKAHKGQRREQEDGPFIVHPLRAAYAMAMDGITDVERLQTCILHDVLEDNPTITPEQIEEKFGKKVRDSVVLLSKETQGVLKDLDEYHADLESHPEEGEDKVYDRSDNMQAWARYEGEDTKRDYKILETLRFILPLTSSSPVLSDRLKAALFAAEASSGINRITDQEVAIEASFLRDRLQRKKIDISLWGHQTKHGVDDLAREILSNETTLTFSEGDDGPVIKHTRITQIRMVYQDPQTGQTYNLYFKERLHSYDNEDTLLWVIRRACAELGIFNIDKRDVDIEAMRTSLGDSTAYPGLISDRKTYPATVRLRSSQFKSEGYDRRTDHLLWNQDTDYSLS